MKRTTLHVSLLALLLPLVLSCTSCQQKPTPQTEITLIHGWGTTDKDHVQMRTIYKDFEKKNPDIKLNLVSMPSSKSVISKANDLLSVGKIPDLIFTGGLGKETLYRFMVEKGYALDLLPYLEQDPVFASDLSPELLDYWTTDDNHLYCASDVLLLSGGYWYNTYMFHLAGIKEPPSTWPEFMQALEQLNQWSKTAATPIVPLQMSAENSSYFADALLLNQNGKTADAMLENRMIMNAKEWNTMLTELKNIYSYSYSSGQDYGYRDELATFNSEQSAIYINGVWANQMITSSIETNYALFPSTSGQSSSCISACLGYLAGNTGNKAKMEASVRFIKYMLSESVQRRILLETGQVPSNPKIKITNYQKSIPRLSQAVQTVRSADIHIQVPDNLWNSGLTAAFQAHIMDVLNGSLTNKDFIYFLK